MRTKPTIFTYLQIYTTTSYYVFISFKKPNVIGQKVDT